MNIYTQVAALPYIVIDDSINICLITSRETKRLVIPKGWPKAGVKSHEMASKEACEEAGLKGNISIHPIGTYTYKKKLHTFASVNCKVEIYPLAVTHQMIEFQEISQREVNWYLHSKAAELVDEPEFSKLLSSLTIHDLTNIQ